MNLQNKSIHPQRIIFGAIAIIGLISAFLPWVKIEMMGFNQSMSGFEGDGKITLILFGVVLVLCLLGQGHQPLSKTYLGVIGGIGAVIFFVFIYNMLNFQNQLNTGLEKIEEYAAFVLGTADINLSDVVKLGMGIWLTLLSGLALVCTAGYMYFEGQNGETVKFNIDTEKIGKTLSDSAKVIKAAGTAATQAVKETIENQKSDEVSNGQSDGSGAQPSDEASANQPTE